jgi:CubicO group peptidase (beta-lactamase class C family)
MMRMERRSLRDQPSGFDARLLDIAIDQVRKPVHTGEIPSAALSVYRHDRCAAEVAFGNKVARPVPIVADVNTIFDMASVTKVIATATAINILFHCAGFPAGGNYRGKKVTLNQITDDIARSKVMYQLGTRFLYSDFSFITLGAVVTAVTGQTLDRFCSENIFIPLGMNDTGFNPPVAKHSRCASTAADINRPENQGYVHDPTALSMGGVAGHAGLFSTVQDVSKWCRMMLGGGMVDGVRIMRRGTVSRMTSPQSPFVGEERGFGVDIASDYNVRGELTVGSYGHTGFTGTSIWLDPANDLFVVLLTNGVHGKPPAKVTAVRRRLHAAISRARND